ncbi:MAG: isocitrate/isopropylmalate family dehydrogenase [Chloroflexota bacterium]
MWTVVLMLEHLGMPAEAARVMRAIEGATASGVLTPDLGGTATTTDVAEEIMRLL